MNNERLLAERLRAHRLTAPARTVADAAAHMLAVQSQDFAAGRWALGARTRGAPVVGDVDAAFDRGELVRAWTMRGTLHTVPARDLRWVLQVTAERQRRQAETRRRQLGIHDDVIAAAVVALRPALRGGGLTRAEIFAVLERIGIDPTGQRGIHLLFLLTIDGLICQGPTVAGARLAREQRFVLVDEHIAEHAQPDDPLAELFVRYITGHGPAGTADFSWWSGLTRGASREAAGRAGARVVEVSEGLFIARDRPRRAPGAVSVHALGAFDEFYISYDDRSTVCAPDDQAVVGPGRNGMVRPVVIADGRVVGTWSHAAATRHAPPELFATASDTDAEAVTAALERAARFFAG